MILLLSQWLANHFHFVSLQIFFGYITVRCGAALLSTLFLSLFLGRLYLRISKHLHLGQKIRVLGPKSHYPKEGTPTMGGIFLFFSVIINILLWSNLKDRTLWFFILTIILFGLIGFWDDYLKVREDGKGGLSFRTKIISQFLAAIIPSLWLYGFLGSINQNVFYLPFLKNFSIFLGPLFLPWAIFLFIGSSNAVNLADGLDGLVIVPVILIFTGLGIFAYLAGNSLFSDHLLIPHIAGGSEFAILSASIAGAGFGFLWYNAHPAEVFLGDVGALPLGASIAFLALAIRQEIILLILSGVLVIETISVIIQVFVYKTQRRRFFRMAPLHHHFEESGVPESHVIIRFWIVSFILFFLALMTLKVR